MILTIIIFILILGLLIFVHEFGHFIMAKRAGIRVEEFGFGFPPRIFGVKSGETIYSLNLFPLGGFVKIYGEDGDNKDDVRSFSSKGVSRRALIIAAGVIMNLVLAVLLLGLGHWIGLPSIIEDSAIGDFEKPRVQIIETAVDSPAHEADLKMGDAIINLKSQILNLKNINTVKEIQEFIEMHKGEEIILTIERGNEILEKRIVPRENPPEGEGALGVALVRTAIVSYPFYKAMLMGAVSTINLVWAIIAAFAGLFWQLAATGRLTSEVAGPVGIFVLTGQAVNLGFIYILQFTAILSINLAIINVLPFPALDGGRLLFLVIEKIKGSPVSQKIEKAVHTAGFALLILLMLAVTWRDVVKLF